MLEELIAGSLMAAAPVAGIAAFVTLLLGKTRPFSGRAGVCIIVLCAIGNVLGLLVFGTAIGATCDLSAGLVAAALGLAAWQTVVASIIGGIVYAGISRMTAGKAFGTLAMLAVGYFLLLLCLSGVGQYKKKHPSSGCYTTLRIIDVALRMYEREHQGRQPDSLQDLVRAHYIMPEQLVVSRQEAWPTESDDVGSYSDYVYVPPSARKGDPSIVAYLPPQRNPWKRGYVLLSDGEVLCLPLVKTHPHQEDSFHDFMKQKRLSAGGSEERQSPFDGR